MQVLELRDGTSLQKVVVSPAVFVPAVLKGRGRKAEAVELNPSEEGKRGGSWSRLEALTQAAAGRRQTIRPGFCGSRQADGTRHD